MGSCKRSCVVRCAPVITHSREGAGFNERTIFAKVQLAVWAGKPKASAIEVWTKFWAEARVWAEGEFGQKAKMGAEGDVARTSEEGARGYITRTPHIINIIYIHTQAHI